MEHLVNTQTRFFHGFWRGAFSSIPFYFVLVAFGALFGVIATEAGLNILQVMSFSVLVLAGASQITAISLLTEQAPTLVVLATSLAVNLRMGMYSAALVSDFGHLPLWKRAFAAYWLFDQPFAMTVIDKSKRPDRGMNERLGFFLGVAIPLASLWYLGTYLGAVMGQSIPLGIGFDFAVPATFLALVAPLLRSVPHLCAALTSAVGAILLRGLPFSTGLLVSAVLALIVGVLVERAMARLKARSVKGGLNNE